VRSREIVHRLKLAGLRSPRSGRDRPGSRSAQR
jgi:hypothetical protein